VSVKPRMFSCFATGACALPRISPEVRRLNAGTHSPAQPARWRQRYHRAMKSESTALLRREWVGAGIVLAIIGSLALTAAGGWGVFATWLNSDKAAGWAQAVGTILAIFAAVNVATRQERVTRALERDRLREQDRRRFLVVEAIMETVWLTCAALHRVWSDIEAEGRDDAIDNFEVAYLEDSRQALLKLPIFEIPDAQLAAYVAGLPRAIADLADTWKRASAESQERDPIEFPAADRVSEKIKLVLDGAGPALAICKASLKACASDDAQP